MSRSLIVWRGHSRQPALMLNPALCISAFAVVTASMWFVPFDALSAPLSTGIGGNVCQSLDYGIRESSDKRATKAAQRSEWVAQVAQCIPDRASGSKWAVDTLDPERIKVIEKRHVSEQALAHHSFLAGVCNGWVCFDVNDLLTPPHAHGPNKPEPTPSTGPPAVPGSSVPPPSEDFPPSVEDGESLPPVLGGDEPSEPDPAPGDSNGHIPPAGVIVSEPTALVLVGLGLFAAAMTARRSRRPAAGSRRD